MCISLSFYLVGVHEPVSSLFHSVGDLTDCPCFTNVNSKNHCCLKLVHKCQSNFLKCDLKINYLVWDKVNRD